MYNCDIPAAEGLKSAKSYKTPVNSDTFSPEKPFLPRNQPRFTFVS